MKSYLAFFLALAVGLCFLIAVSSTARATGYGQQVFVPQQFNRQRSVQRSRGSNFSSFQRQQFNSGGGGRQRSFSFQSSSSGRGGFGIF